MLPRHPTEVDRLDVQHYALRAALNGNYLAPIGQPSSILDVGSGSGQWGYELAAQYPEALAVGLDLVPGKPGAPANFRMIRANLLHGLPFADASFDFVHMRLLTAGIPVQAYPAVIRGLLRVTRPGGWVELVEARTYFEPEGPATKRVYDVLRPLALQAGFDTGGIVHQHLKQYLVLAGAEAAQDRVVEMPLGEWGGQIGSWMHWDLRVLFGHMLDLLQTLSGLERAACSDMVAAMLEELERLRSIVSVRIAFGRRAVVTGQLALTR